MKIAKTERKSLDSCQRAMCDSYSILFNFCGSPSYCHWNQIKENKCAFSLRRFRLEKVHFSSCFIQNWEEIESLKIEKSPGKVLEFCFPHFRTNPGKGLTSALMFHFSISTHIVNQKKVILGIKCKCPQNIVSNIVIVINS